jgi:FG-GAP-like repeat
MSAGQSDGITVVFSLREVTGPPQEASARVLFGELDGKPGLEIMHIGNRLGSVAHINKRLIKPALSFPPFPVGNSSALLMDADNDRRLDLVLFGKHGLKLWMQKSSGSYANIPQVLCSTLNNLAGGHTLDYNRDGWLDLVVWHDAQKGGVRLLLNNGDLSFTDVSDIQNNSRVVAVDSGDLDGDGDPDLVILDSKMGIRLFLNHRNNRLEENEPLIGSRFSSGLDIMLLDFDNDTDLDILATSFAGQESLRLLRNDGSGAFKPIPHSIEGVPPLVSRLCVLDYDNDGLADLSLIGSSTDSIKWRVHLYRGLGEGRYDDLSHLLPKYAGAFDLAACDFDSDGDDDLAALSKQGVSFIENLGGNKNKRVVITLQADPAPDVKENSFAIGSQLEIVCGTHYRKQIVRHAQTSFGLGKMATAEAMRVQWTNGSTQQHKNLSGKQTIVQNMEQRFNKPFIHTWDGARYAYQGELDALTLPSEDIKEEEAQRNWILTNQHIAMKTGEVKVAITQEMWGVLYAESFGMLVVDLPPDVELANDISHSSLSTQRLSFFRKGRAPIVAIGHDRANHRDALLHHDNKYARLSANQDREWYITLDFGSITPSATTVLRLSGCTLQRTMGKEPALKAWVGDGRGGWKQVSRRLGSFNLFESTLFIDLSDVLEPGDARVKIGAACTALLNEARLLSEQTASQPRISELFLVGAKLYERGFSRIREALDSTPASLDFNTISSLFNTRRIAGHYTPGGNVLNLLLANDGALAALGGGDALLLSFANQAIPALPQGWHRCYVLTGIVWIKPGHKNTISCETVMPLPYCGMLSYPYARQGNATRPLELSRWANNHDYLRQWSLHQLQTADQKGTTDP